MEWELKGRKIPVQNREIQDDYRIDFVKDHLRELHQAIQDGANCRDYLMWTFIDYWSWLNGYKKPRYGLVELDLTTQRKTPEKIRSLVPLN